MTNTLHTSVVDPRRLEHLLGRAVVDAGATMAAGLVVLGSRLGLYQALADGPLTAAALAERTGTAERYVREWANAQAAGGYLTYDADRDRYGLSAEQALAFDPDGPVNVTAMFRLAVSVLGGLDRLERSMRTGRGVAWHEHGAAVAGASAEFYRAGYLQHLLDHWIPAMDGVPERLTRGARVADIGCGYGITTVLMAKRYPASIFHGFDSDAGSIERARSAAVEAGVADRVSFEVCDAAAIPALGYNLVCTFDALHDYGNPRPAARRVRESLVPGGSWMIVEPRAGDTVTDNLHPVGRMFYAGSIYLCVPTALAQGSEALGAQAGERTLHAILTEAGFGDVRTVAETPFNAVLQARP